VLAPGGAESLLFFACSCVHKQLVLRRKVNRKLLIVLFLD
jgi:hypothetical protein